MFWNKLRNDKMFSDNILKNSGLGEHFQLDQK